MLHLNFFQIILNPAQNRNIIQVSVIQVSVRIQLYTSKCLKSVA